MDEGAFSGELLPQEEPAQISVTVVDDGGPEMELTTVLTFARKAQAVKLPE